MVTEAERDRIIAVLRDSFAADELSHEEFDSRLTAALEAESRRDLAALVAHDHGQPARASIAARETVTPAHTEALAPHLAHNEWIEWAAGPDPARHLNRGDVFLIPFSLMFLVFALAWESAVVAIGQPVAVLFGLPFVAAGLYMAVGRFIYKARRRRRTVYAVTNQRVLSVVQRRNGADVDAKSLRALTGVSTTAGRGGRGTIEFDGGAGPRAPVWMADSGMGFFGNLNARVGLCFFDVEHASDVAALIERVRADAYPPL
jgi:hypothetical protein